MPGLRDQLSAWLDTALYQLKTPPQRVGEVLSAVAEGLTVNAAVRVFGHGEPMFRGWLPPAGRHAQQVHAPLFAQLVLRHVQLDETRTRPRRHSSVLWL